MKQIRKLAWWLIVVAILFVGGRLALAEDLPEWDDEGVVYAQVSDTEGSLGGETEEEGKIGDWSFQADTSLPVFVIQFDPTRVSFNEAGIGVGFSVTRETNSVLDPKFALYLYPKSRAESGGMDLGLGGEVSLLSVGRFHLVTIGGMYSITEDEGALTVGVSAGLMK